MKLMVLFLGLLGAAFAFASGNAESARDAALIARVKNVPVAKLDAALPALPFEQWLVVEAGKDASFRWEVNDCGEQTGAPGQNPDEIPTCVEADASLKDGREIVIMIGVEKSSHGNAGMSVDFAQLVTTRERITIKQLSDFPAALVRTHAPAHNPEIVK